MCPSSPASSSTSPCPTGSWPATSAGGFEMPGATGVVAEALLAADLTVALVLDDGRESRRDDPHPARCGDRARAQHPRGRRAAGRDGERGDRRADDGPSGDARRRRHARHDAGGAGSTVAPAAIRAAAVLEAAPDGRRQLVVVTAAGAEITPDEAELLMASLDRSGSALRVLSIGGDAGPRLSAVADATGGFAVDVGTGPAAALRAVDALTTTFTDQYRVTATVAAPGDQLVRLTMSGRRYETVVPDIGASAAPPTTTSPDDDDEPDDGPADDHARPGPAQGPPSAADPPTRAATTGHRHWSPAPRPSSPSPRSVRSSSPSSAPAPSTALSQRTVRKKARTSSTKVAGRSKAAKWPPASSSFQWRMSVKRRSAQRRDARKISLGKIDIPDGTVTSARRPVRKLCQYRRPEDAPAPGSQ